MIVSGSKMLQQTLKTSKDSWLYMSKEQTPLQAYWEVFVAPSGHFSPVSFYGAGAQSGEGKEPNYKSLLQLYSWQRTPLQQCCSARQVWHLLTINP